MLNIYRWSWTQLYCEWGRSLGLVVWVALSGWGFNLTWIPDSYDMVLLSLQHSGLQKGYMISNLVNLEPRVKQLERPAGFAQHQVDGAENGRDGRFLSPGIFACCSSGAGNSPAKWALLILELRAKGNQPPAALTIETFTATQKTSLASWPTSML